MGEVVFRHDNLEVVDFEEKLTGIHLPGNGAPEKGLEETISFTVRRDIGPSGTRFDGGIGSSCSVHTDNVSTAMVPAKAGKVLLNQ
ncbi:hypothetical protein ACFQDJ_09360 [Pseudomonas brassicacearum]